MSYIHIICFTLFGVTHPNYFKYYNSLQSLISKFVNIFESANNTHNNIHMVLKMNRKNTVLLVTILSISRLRTTFNNRQLCESCQYDTCAYDSLPRNSAFVLTIVCISLST